MPLKQQKPDDPLGVTIEAWSQGWMVGALVLMACVTVTNMRRKVLLHKLILIELLFGMPVGTFIFVPVQAYHWYLSITALFLYVSWSLHNVIAWLKNKPFLNKKASLIYIGTVIFVQPFWICEMIFNFFYFGGWNDLFTHSRPFEPLFRDPWWVFTVLNLFWNIKTKYEFGFAELIRVSPRFGILLGAMILSLLFMVVDILSVTGVLPSHGLPDGINPFWKCAYVFKCLTDTIVLDDFKTALDRLAEYKLQRIGSVFSDGIRGDFSEVVEARENKYDGSTALSRQSTNLALRSSHATRKRDWTELNELGGLDLESVLHIDDIARIDSRYGTGGPRQDQGDKV